MDRFRHQDKDRHFTLVAPNNKKFYGSEMEVYKTQLIRPTLLDFSL